MLLILLKICLICISFWHMCYRIFSQLTVNTNEFRNLITYAWLYNTDFDPKLICELNRF